MCVSGPVGLGFCHGFSVWGMMQYVNRCFFSVDAR